MSKNLENFLINHIICLKFITHKSPILNILQNIEIYIKIYTINYFIIYLNFIIKNIFYIYKFTCKINLN